MGKRGLDDAELVEQTHNVSRKRIKRPEIDNIVNQSRKALHRALKLAKGFERQKLSRRQKTAKQANNTNEISRIEAEIEACRTLDVGQVVNGYLSRLVIRDKVLSEYSEITESATVPQRTVTDQATKNVTARLYNSNAVKNAVQESLRGLHAFVEALQDSSKSTNKTNANTTSSSRISNSASGRLEADSKSEKSARASDSRVQNPERFGKSPEASDDDDDDSSIGDSDVSALEQHFTSRLAPGSDEEDEKGDSEANVNDCQRTDDEWSGSDSEDTVLDHALEVSSDNDFDGTEPHGRSIQDLPSKSTAKPAEDNGSTHLPAFMNVGYLSGSDSEASEAESLPDEPPKRNRRGQRARQKIWKQKFGHQAKHLQKPRKGRSGRDEGWDPKKGARESRYEKKRIGQNLNMGASAKSNVRADSNKPQQAFSSAGSSSKIKRDDTGALHPSWEAKKRSKNSSGAKPFQGQKVVFD